MYKVFELHHQKSTCLTVIYSSSKVYNLFLVTVSIIKSVSSSWLSTEISSWPKVIPLFFSCDSIPSFTHLTVSLYKIYVQNHTTHRQVTFHSEVGKQRPRCMEKKKVNFLMKKIIGNFVLLNQSNVTIKKKML